MKTVKHFSAEEYPPIETCSVLLHDELAEEKKTMAFIPEPMFYVIHAVRAGFDAFTIEGVFTKAEDADEWVKNLESLPYIQAVARPQLLPWRTVVELFVADRLGKIAEVLRGRL